MTTNWNPSTTVVNTKTNETGRLLGQFTRKGETWWTIYWETGETTSMCEKEIFSDE
mgnify:CR=1 FL=1